MKTTKSPDLSTSIKLADVIAALQATATYKFYLLKFEGDKGSAWRIAGDASKETELRRVSKSTLSSSGSKVKVTGRWCGGANARSLRC